METTALKTLYDHCATGVNKSSDGVEDEPVATEVLHRESFDRYFCLNICRRSFVALNEFYGKY